MQDQIRIYDIKRRASNIPRVEDDRRKQIEEEQILTKNQHPRAVAFAHQQYNPSGAQPLRPNTT